MNDTTTSSVADLRSAAEAWRRVRATGTDEDEELAWDEHERLSKSLGVCRIPLCGQRRDGKLPTCREHRPGRP
jgi:hypothetical protein